MNKPTTQAGRHFRDVMHPYVVVPDGWWGDMGPGVEGLVVRIEAEAAAAERTRLLNELVNEIVHAEMNGHLITDGQGLGPGEKVPGVRSEYLRALVERLR